MYPSHNTVRSIDPAAMARARAMLAENSRKAAAETTDDAERARLLTVARISSR